MHIGQKIKELRTARGLTQEELAENGTMKERNVIPVNNASHICKSNNGEYLYSIADEGVEVLKIDQETGDLEPINKVGIDGMRGCFLSTDISGKFLFVGGYHDGKITVVRDRKSVV